jgi:hypothetical protein
MFNDAPQCSASIRLPGFYGKGLHSSDALADDLAMAIDSVKDGVSVDAGRHGAKISEACLIQQVAQIVSRIDVVTAVARSNRASPARHVFRGFVPARQADAYSGRIYAVTYTLKLCANAYIDIYT